MNLEEFIYGSFVSPLITNPNITDISYNGDKIFYEDRTEGRKCSDIVISNLDASNFIRQIANLTEKQFSFSSPILDVSFGKYRINAVHPSVSRYNQNKAISFSIRIASFENMIEKDKNFLPMDFLPFIKEALLEKKSIIIGGKTGTGKTELQKFLLSNLINNEKVILIDQIDEIGYSAFNEKIDITHWVCNGLETTKIPVLISNALRCNPDWIVVSEARGSEMGNVLLSCMSGHPIITTIHAKECNQMIPRVIRMINSTDKSSTYQELEDDIYNHFDYFIYVSKTKDQNNKIKRFISSIGKSEPTKKEMKIIYKKSFINDLALETRILRKEGK